LGHGTDVGNKLPYRFAHSTDTTRQVDCRPFSRLMLPLEEAEFECDRAR
jgi:hypothetical protein